MELNFCCPGFRAGTASAFAFLALAGVTGSLGTAGAAGIVPVRPLVLNGASPVQRVAIFGSDDRVLLPDTHRNLESSIGLLYEARSHSVCTAFCVSDNTIATAAHCLFRTAGEKAPKLSGFTFRLTVGARAVARKASPLAGTETGNAGQYVMAGSTKLSINPPIEASRDWALARLARPICKGARLAVSRRPASDLIKLSAAQRIYQVAFHRDFGSWQLAYGAPCPVRRTYGAADWKAITRDFSDPERLILHTCDTGGASSGSPLLIDGPAGPEVVGINVGTYVQSKVLMRNQEVVHRYQADTVANTGVSSTAFLSKLEAFTGADILATRERVRELQELLSMHGLYSGPRDGAFGPVLRTAIETFERSEGRPETGLATAGLLKRLSALKAEALLRLPAGKARGLETSSVGSHQPTKASGSLPDR